MISDSCVGCAMIIVHRVEINLIYLFSRSQKRNRQQRFQWRGNTTQVAKDSLFYHCKKNGILQQDNWRKRSSNFTYDFTLCHWLLVMVYFAKYPKILGLFFDTYINTWDRTWGDLLRSITKQNKLWKSLYFW